MSKFCIHCGQPLEEESAFCTSCGKAVNAAPVEAPAETPAETVPVETPVETAPAETPVEAPAEAAPAKTTDVIGAVTGFLAKVADKVQEFTEKATVYAKDYIAKAKEKPTMWIAPGAIAVGVVALFIILFVLLFGNKYTSALDNYIDFNFYGKVSALEKLAPAEYWDYYEDEYDMSLDDLKEKYEDAMDDRLESLEDEYGKRIKVTYKITDEDDISKRKLEKLAEALEDRYDINAKSVTAGKKVDVEITIKGSEDDDDTEQTLNFLKIGGRWYMVNYYESDDEYVVYFDI